MHRRNFLLSLPAALAASRFDSKAATADPDARQLITAGPFNLHCPKAWAEGAKTQKIAARPLYTRKEWKEFQKDSSHVLKPSYDNRPEHWEILLPKLRTPGAQASSNPDDDGTTPHILIHRTSEWTAVYQDGKTDKALEEKTVAELRGKLDEMINEPNAFSSPEYFDASFTFLSLKRPLTFKGGRGVRMIGQWTIEPTLVSKGHLHYLFIGMSDDNSCQIIATFPLNLEGLPENRDLKATHLGYGYGDKNFNTQFDEYEKAAQAWLTKRAPKIQPNLSELDALIEGLEAKTWP